MKGIEEALSKLDRLTREEVDMAIVQIATVTRQTQDGVNQLIQGTFITLTTHRFQLKPTIH
jgi:BMFP domain-containing protein YqiC